MLFEGYALDLLAFVWFAVYWIGLEWRIARSPPGEGLSAVMNEYRRYWMRNMLKRELRMVDTQIQGSLQQGIMFFASTSVLATGGLMAALGATDEALRVLAELPLPRAVNRTLFELKLLLLIGIFLYAFFKFAWCYRLFTYCSILLGAAPQTEADLAREPSTTRFVERMSTLHVYAGEHFNSGLRAYFYALGALTWFVHPLVFILATTWVTWICFRREYLSRSFRLLRAGLEDPDRTP